MEKLAKNVVNFCNTLAPYAYVGTVVVCLIVGIMLLLPSEKAHDKAKSYGGWAIVGTMLISGCVTIGKWIAGNWTF